MLVAVADQEDLAEVPELEVMEAAELEPMELTLVHFLILLECLERLILAEAAEELLMIFNLVKLVELVVLE
jgi:hypothetical protein